MKSLPTKLNLLRSALPHAQIAVAVDPGRRKSGCVVLVTKPLLAVVFTRRLTNADLCDLLWEVEPDLICIEGFRLYPWIARDKRWDYFPEIRIIGAVEEIARSCSINLVEVTPSQSKQSVPNALLYLLETWAICHHTTDAFRVFWTVVLGRLDWEVVDDESVAERVVVGKGMR